MGASRTAARYGGLGNNLTRWLIATLLVGALAFRTDGMTALSQADHWSTTSLSEPRANILTATIGDVAIFAGGTTQGAPSNAVDIYDRATRQWTTATLSVGRTSPGTVTVGTKILVAGGREGSGAVSRVLDVYDIATGGWSATSLSQPWSGGEGITVGAKALFPGPEAVDIFDAPSGLVTTATLSQPRTGAVLAAVGTRVIFAGGTAENAPSAAVDIYDSATDTWTTASLSQARSEIKVAVVGARALFAGGVSGDQPSTVVDIYDATTGAWSTARLSEARRGIRVAATGNTALFAGGYNQKGQATANEYTATVDLYDGTTDTWSTAKLSEARGVFVAAAGSQALFAAPRTCVFRPECPDLADVYDSRTGAWSTTHLHVPRFFSPGITDAGRAVGGTVISVRQPGALRRWGTVCHGRRWWRLLWALSGRFRQRVRHGDRAVVRGTS
jgi:hypothetical protein